MNQTPSAKDLSILIVDDKPEIREIINALLLASGCENVKVVRNGVNALELIKQGLIPHVIVTDYEMPEKTGLEFLADARTHLDGKLLSIVLMSGNHDELQVFYASTKTMYPEKPIIYLRKPFRGETAIKAILEKKQPLYGASPLIVLRYINPES